MVHDPDTTLICFCFSFRLGWVSEQSLFLRSSYIKLQMIYFSAISTSQTLTLLTVESSSAVNQFVCPIQEGVFNVAEEATR